MTEESRPGCHPRAAFLAAAETTKKPESEVPSGFI